MAGCRADLIESVDDIAGGIEAGNGGLKTPLIDQQIALFIAIRAQLARQVNRGNQPGRPCADNQAIQRLF